MFKHLRAPAIALVGTAALLAAACTEDEGPPQPDSPPVEEDDDVEAERNDGRLDLGYLLPETGQLNLLGSAQINGVQLAVEEVNAAGGVLGEEVTLESGDEGQDPEQARQEAERLLTEGVDAIIGAAASSLSLAIIDQVSGSEVVQCSASNHSAAFTDYDADGFYFRTVASEALQGPVLAELIAQDGNERVAFIARNDEYGTSVLESTRDELEDAGAEVVAEVLHDPEQGTYDAEVEEVQAADPDAVALLIFSGDAEVIQSMIEAGIGPESVNLYSGDALRTSELPELVEPGNPNVLDGLQGTFPDPQADADFLERLRDFDPETEETVFAAQAYDCVVLLALAAEAAGTADPAEFKEEIVDLTRGGEKCSSFDECSQLLEEGADDLDYDGPSGPLDFTEKGEPDAGSFEVWRLEGGELTSTDTSESTLE